MISTNFRFTEFSEVHTLRSEFSRVEGYPQRRDLAFLDVQPVSHRYWGGHRRMHVVPSKHVLAVNEGLPDYDLGYDPR